MLANYYAVIMAGGGGTRFWPLSRKARPKQMLRLLEERSLFQTSVERLDGVFTPDRIYVVTVEEQAEELQQQCPEIPLENYLLEPMPRGTASVIGLASVAIQEQRSPGGDGCAHLGSFYWQRAAFASCWRLPMMWLGDITW